MKGTETGIQGVLKIFGQILGVSSPQQSRKKFYNNLCSQTRVFRGSPQQRIVRIFQIFI
jgi:hypothetical protein